MTCILPDIHTIEQHFTQLQNNPEAYRPKACPGCGRSGLWCHGCYCRKSNRDTGHPDPVSIPRFQCPHCRRTCSVLPECIPPRRWYLWVVQSAVICGLLAGQSLRKLAQKLPPARSSMRRWWQRCQACFDQHAFHLRNRFVELGRHQELASFWFATLDRIPLSTAMLLLNQAGISIP